MDCRFNQLALSLFALQFTHNPAYRRICEARKISPQSIKDWREIPAVPTAAFKQLELTSLPPEQRTTVFYSSGTTGQTPSRHFHGRDSLAIYETSLLAWFRPHFPNAQSTCLLSLTPPASAAPHSSLVHMFETLRRELHPAQSFFTGTIDQAGVWELDLAKTVEAMQRALSSNQPVTVLGTAFNFVHLLDHLTETKQKFRLPSGSCVLETGGYKSRSRALPKPELHALITKLVGVPATHIVSEYGMSELSSQAYDVAIGQLDKPATDVVSPSPWGEGWGEGDNDIRNPKSPSETLLCCAENILQRTFHFPPWARARIISPETGREVAEGETGLIRLFDLANICSVMAIQTEDLGVRRGEGFELLGRAAQAESRGCSLMSV